MDAKELRLGNYVVNDKIIVNEIILSKHGNEIGINDGFVYNENKVNPIPITEEWLLKFGFYQEKDDEYYFDISSQLCFYAVEYIFNITFYLENECEVMELKHIKYVHQLQNLYFALTNNELTIK